MKWTLVSLHVALILSTALPVYGSWDWDWSMTWNDPRPSGNSGHPIWSLSPLENLAGQSIWLPSVAAAGLPGALALLNLPLVVALREATGECWRAYSSIILGLLSTFAM